nr:sigma-70 factor domain-containing protein [Thermogutta sp.]
MALYEADHLFDELELRSMEDEEELEFQGRGLLEMAESYADDELAEDEEAISEEAYQAAANLEESEEDTILTADEEESWSDDPVRMYLTQMGEIPLLSRQEEIALAKKIEITRAKFRRKLMECDYVLQQAVRTLARVDEGKLPFDRTVQVSVTDHLEKEQILGRLPHNLRTLQAILKRNRQDYLTALSKSKPMEERRAAWRRLGRSRRRAGRLAEELGLRTQRLEPMIKALEEFSRRVDELKARIQEHANAGRPLEERKPWIKQYRDILRLTQE